MRLHIIRHGDPNYQDDCLTLKGREEAEALVRYTETLPIRSIFSSPMGRARETAEPTAKRLGLPVTILPWTREIHLPSYDHPKRGKVAVWNAEPERLAACERYPGGWLKDPIFEPPFGEEKFAEIYAGLNEFFAQEGIFYNNGAFTAEHPLKDGDIALFCHLGFGFALLGILTNMPATFYWRSYFIATSSVTTIRFEEDDGIVNPRITALGCTPHLFKANF